MSVASDDDSATREVLDSHDQENFGADHAHVQPGVFVETETPVGVLTVKPTWCAVLKPVLRKVTLTSRVWPGERCVPSGMDIDAARRSRVATPLPEDLTGGYSSADDEAARAVGVNVMRDVATNAAAEMMRDSR